MKTRIPSMVEDGMGAMNIANLLRVNEKLAVVYEKDAIAFGGVAVWLMTGTPRAPSTGPYERRTDMDFFVPAMTKEYALRMKEQDLNISDSLDRHCYVYYKASASEKVPIDLVSFDVSFFDIPYRVIESNTLRLHLEADGKLNEGSGQAGELTVVNAPVLAILKTRSLGRNRPSDAEDLGRLLDFHWGGSAQRFIDENKEIISMASNGNASNVSSLKYSLNNFSKERRK